MQPDADSALMKPQISLHTKNSGLDLEIQTPRLYIRAYRDSDFEKCVTLYGDEKITKYFDHGKPRSRLEVEDYVRERGRKYLDKGEPFGLFSIFDKKDMAFVGQVDLLPTEDPGVVEIGCILFKEYHDQLIGTEAVKVIIHDYLAEIIRRGFKAHGATVYKLIGTVHPKNSASKKLIEKLGMTYDKTQERFGNPRLWYSYIPKVGHKWRAEEYHRSSSAQSDAATALLKNILFKGNEKVLDVGCGDGKITAMIAGLIPHGSVLGIDVSPQMINFAQNKYPENQFNNLRFALKDAQSIDYNEGFDIIFSSFALQWVMDQNSFLNKAYKSLKPAGSFVATIPLGISLALDKAIKEVIALPDWSMYFRNFTQTWHFTGLNEFSELLKLNQFTISHLVEKLQEVIFPSRQTFEEYVIQWFPYLQPLPECSKAMFFRLIIDRYLELEPLLNHGEVRFAFERLEIIASKTIV